MIPEIVNLLDSMKDTDSPNQPTATAALAYFKEICGILTEEDLEHSVEATRWISGVCTLVHMGMYGVYFPVGRMQYRAGPPVYFAPQ